MLNTLLRKHNFPLLFSPILQRVLLSSPGETRKTNSLSSRMTSAPDRVTLWPAVHRVTLLWGHWGSKQDRDALWEGRVIADVTLKGPCWSLWVVLMSSPLQSWQTRCHLYAARFNTMKFCVQSVPSTRVVNQSPLPYFNMSWPQE